jgi:hypothetical protein
MDQTAWSDKEKKVYLCLYGVVVVGLTILAISHLIEACRSRPKVLALYIGVKADPEKSDPEISSAEK